MSEGRVPQVEEHASSQFRRRTVVFTLPPRTHVLASDFALHFAKVVDGCRLQAFGTVGVGHVWHLTVDSEVVAKAIVAQGDFFIGEVPVNVKLMDLVSFTIFVHWLPFWVPHLDVERSLCRALEGNYTSSYVRIDQKGFPGCFSTQRRVHSTVDVRQLPHFLSIRSEGINYRAFLFIPGREPVCFQCGKLGHMKDKCGGKQVVQQTIDMVVPSANTGPPNPPSESGGSVGSKESDTSSKSSSKAKAKVKISQQKVDKAGKRVTAQYSKMSDDIDPAYFSDSVLQQLVQGCDGTDECVVWQAFCDQHVGAEFILTHLIKEH